MRLPNAEVVVVEPAKVRNYLLSREHPVGRFKARFFEALGFRADRWEDLVDSLRQLAQNHEAEVAEGDDYGRRYVVRGKLRGAEGRSARVTSVWIVLDGEEIPRLVTVYPER